jgi:MinD superfamily P-loop ATPase
MIHIISVMNHKGGVGKTNTNADLHLLAKRIFLIAQSKCTCQATTTPTRQIIYGACTFCALIKVPVNRRHYFR